MRRLVVVHALAGKETLWIAGGLGRSRAFVQRWVFAHRDDGIDALAPHGGKCRVLFMGEARFGRQGTLTRMWAPRGSRPVAGKQTRSEWVCLYAPELNPLERLWAYLSGHDLANRVFDDDQHLLDAGAEAWQPLNPDRLRSVCACPYLSQVLER